MPSPMYQQIADDLRKKIESGQLPPGAQLPRELELQDEYDASRNTIRDAIKTLINQHLVETRPGQGTFVTRTIDPLINTIGLQVGEDPAYSAEVHSQHRRATTSEPEVRVQSAGQPLTSELSLLEGTQVISRSHQIYVDDIAWILQAAFYPMDLFKRGAQRLLDAEHPREGSFAYIANTLGIVSRTWQAKMVARSPDDYEASFFGLSAETGWRSSISARSTMTGPGARSA